MYDPNNYDANGNLKNPMLQQMAQTAMQATTRYVKKTTLPASGVGTIAEENL